MIMIAADIIIIRTVCSWCCRMLMIQDKQYFWCWENCHNKFIDINKLSHSDTSNNSIKLMSCEIGHLRRTMRMIIQSWNKLFQAGQTAGRVILRLILSLATIYKRLANYHISSIYTECDKIFNNIHHEKEDGVFCARDTLLHTLC